MKLIKPEAELRASRTSSPKRLSLSQYAEGIVAGDRSVLAKAITLIESSHPADCSLAAELLELCLKQECDSIVVGVTGVPGAGKSSLIDVLGQHIINTGQEKVAVLAVDPSSRATGGSILGDKTRMAFLASSERAFIRPSPSGSWAGGVAAHTREVILLCKAAGYRNVFIETVGVGQSETSVRDMADFLLLVAIAGAGDDLQGIKRGVMEMADAIAVNKADGDNLREAEKARAVAEMALHYFPPSPSGWTPRACICSARTGIGVGEIWSQIAEHHRTLSQNGFLARMRREQNLTWLHEGVDRGLKQIFLSTPAVQKRLAGLEEGVANGQLNAVAAARQLLSLFDGARQRRRGKQNPQP